MTVQTGDYAVHLTPDRLSETDYKSASRSSATVRTKPCDSRVFRYSAWAHYSRQIYLKPKPDEAEVHKGHSEASGLGFVVVP